MQSNIHQSQADSGGLARPPSLAFRGDIQGIRALAIILVIACHAALPGFGGGYIGVDMFFVISGYLITGLLFREVSTRGSMDLLRFYARRCKRLLPALLLVTGLTLLLARIVLSPVEQVEQSRVALWVSLWLGNVHFSLADLDYFAPEASSNLFLHTWSLGVEEQFYLLWPFLIGALYAQYRKALPGDDSKVLRQLQLGLAIVLVASLALCLFWSFQAPLFGFYMMPSRAWQFAAGGLVFLVMQEERGTVAQRWLTRLGSWSGMVGLAAIALMVVWIDEDMVYPGFLALIPTVATALLLVDGGAAGTTRVTQILSLRWLQWIGDLSYSWYLWHWPVFVLGGLLFGSDSGAYGVRLALVAVSLLAAIMTYYTVEAPLRGSALLSRKPALVVSLAVAGMAVMAWSTQLLDSRASGDAVSSDQMPFLQVRSNLPALYQTATCDEWYSSARVVACAYGNQQAEHTAVLIGDSIGAQWFSALAVPLVEAGWRFVVYTKSACPIVDKPIFYVRIKQIYENCALWRQQLPESVAQLEADLIFIGSSGAYEYTTAQWESGTASVLGHLAPLAKELFIIAPTPTLPFDGPRCLARQSWQPDWLKSFTSCSAPLATLEHVTVSTALESAIAQHANVRFLDLNSLVCPAGVCSAEREDGFVYRDSAHLADVFVAQQSQHIFELMRTASDQHIEAPWETVARH